MTLGARRNNLGAGVGCTLLSVKRFIWVAGVVAVGLYGCGSHPASVPPSGTTSPGQTESKDQVANQPGSPSQGTTQPNDPVASTNETPTKGTETRTADGSKPGSAKVAPKVPTASEGWSPSTTKAEALAKSADLKVGSLKSASAKIVYDFKDIGKTKGSGFSKCDIAIKDPSKFRVEFPSIGEKISRISKDTVIADGTRLTVLNSDGMGPKVPIGSWPIRSISRMEDWMEGFPSVIFSPLRGSKPLGDLVATAMKQGGAPAATVEQRTFEYKGHVFTQKRLVIHIAPNGRPTIDIKVVIDGEHNLPVTIDAVRNSSKADAMMVHWTAAWDLNPKQGFKSDLFMLPIHTQSIIRRAQP